jgi:nucleotide-binding universal stress UspA family protein
MAAQLNAIEERLATLKESFMAATSGCRSATWRGGIGDPTRLLALHARAADLIVIGPPEHGRDDRLRTVDAAAVVLSSGRPILVASAELAAPAASSVLVAWRDTREARRAVVDALPFLVGADEVLALTLEDEDQETARDSGADLVRFLRKHGIRARCDVVGVGASDGAGALAAAAAEIGADLVVSGGYGRSRLREWAFGGMTRSLLRDNSLNRLMSN